jgi:hypothetical protein
VLVRPGSAGDPFKFQTSFYVNGPKDAQGYFVGQRKLHASTKAGLRKAILEHRRAKNPSAKATIATIKRDVWVPAKIMVTKAGKILAKVAGKVAGKVTGKRNPSGDYDSWGKKDWAAAAFKAGRQFDAASSGVANARVVTYGFSKWFNSLPPGYPPRGKGVTKPYLLKSFREGMQWDLGKRNPARKYLK